MMRHMPYYHIKSIATLAIHMKDNHDEFHIKTYVPTLNDLATHNSLCIFLNLTVLWGIQFYAFSTMLFCFMGYGQCWSNGM